MKTEISVYVRSRPVRQVNKKIGYQSIVTLTVLSSEALNIDVPSQAKSTQRTLAEWALNTVDSPLLHERINITT